jgi:hypothetical protein
MDLGVRFAGAFVRTIADNDAFIGDDRRADDRVRRGAADSPARLLECATHPPDVGLGGFAVV